MSHAYESDSDAESFRSAHDGHESRAEESTEATTVSSHQPVVQPPETARDATTIASDGEAHPDPNANASHAPPATKPSSPDSTPIIDPTTQERLPPALEASLLASSNASKSTGNALFSTSSFSSAIQSYDRALADCPAYLDYEIAVLRANVAACHLKLQEWKEAVEQATQGLQGLERLDPLPVVRGEENGQGKGEGKEAVSYTHLTLPTKRIV